MAGLIIKGMRLGSRIHIPHFGFKSNWPNNFSEAHMKILRDLGFEFEPSDAIVPRDVVLSGEGRETIASPPEHISEAWEGDTGKTPPEQPLPAPKKPVPAAAPTDPKKP